MRAGLFPGQGIEADNVLAGLPEGHPTIDDASAILGYDLRRAVAQICRRVKPVLPTTIAQAAIFVAGLISFDAAVARRQFAYLVGHSLGEYTALVAAESIPFTHGLQLVAARGKAMQRVAVISSGAMAAVRGLTLADVEEIALASDTTVANDNSPTQVVLSGDETSLARAAGLVRERQGRSVLLPVEGAYHSSAMRPAVSELAAALDHTDIRSPKIPVLSNVSARPYRAPGEIRKLLLEQLTGRVRFRECIAYLAQGGVTEFIDFGPGRVVGRLARANAARVRETVDA